MKKWVCKQCGLYQKVSLDRIKAGCKVYFYNKNHAEQINLGVVLKRNDDIITIVSNAVIARVKANDVYPVNAPANFVYNMFGACQC